MMSIDYASQMDLTEFATFYGDFYISNDLIEASKRDVIAAGIATDIHADALALLTKETFDIWGQYTISGQGETQFTTSCQASEFVILLDLRKVSLRRLPPQPPGRTL